MINSQSRELLFWQSSKRDDTSISPMMLPLILYDHAWGRVQDTNVKSAFFTMSLSYTIVYLISLMIQKKP
jgi:hypothetical protein